MADEKSKKKRRPTAQKRDIQNAKRQGINRAFKARVRTAIRDLHAGLPSGEQETLKEKLNSVYSLMDKGVKRGVFARNKASRFKARYSSLVQQHLAA